MPNASPPRKSSNPDALLIALVAGDSGLSRRGLGALLRLRTLQREIMRGSRGAFVKIEPQENPPLLELGQIGRDSPLAADYHSLVVLELAREFPEHGERLRNLLDARRHGQDLAALATALWREDGAEAFMKGGGQYAFDPHLMAATLWIALKPLYETVAQAFARHFELPQGGLDCPACGGPPWARCDDRLRCGVCESVWTSDAPGNWRKLEGPQPRGAHRYYNPHTGQRIIELEPLLFEDAYDNGPFIELLQTLEA